MEPCNDIFLLCIPNNYCNSSLPKKSKSQHNPVSLLSRETEGYEGVNYHFVYIYWICAGVSALLLLVISSKKQLAKLPPLMHVLLSWMK